MNTRSLRFQLTSWNISAFLIVTFLVFLGFYIVAGKILSVQTNNSLLAHNVHIVNLITNDSVGIHGMLTREAFAREFKEIPGMLVVAMDSNGQTFNSSQALNDDRLIFLDLFNQAKEAHRQIFADKKIDNTLMRFLVTPIYQKDDTLQGVILMAHPTDVIQKSLSILFIALSAVFVGMIIPVSWMGYLLVSRAMRPIEIMSDKLKKIGSENLNDRVGNPRTGDELEELALTFNLLLDRLHQAFNRERQFIGDVAHELKTPLSTIRSSVEITLSKSRTSANYKRALKEVLIDTDKLNQTLKNILDLAWSESDLVKSPDRPFDLSQILEDMRDIATKLALVKPITVKSIIQPGVKIVGRSDKLGRAILNIIDNAIKFTPPKGQITLKLYTSKSQAVISIKDSGMGIKEVDIPHIFERFYRGDEASKILGSGLGLAIVSSIINSHHGKIEVKSSPGRGSEFIIFLPFTESS